MRNTSGSQGKNDQQRQKFLEVLRCRRAKQRQRNVQKKSVRHVQRWLFFAVFVVVAAWLALRDFIFCFSKL